MNIKEIVTGTGIIGMVITVLLSPCCFPLFGFILTAFGFGSSELFGGWTVYVFQVFILISLIGFVLSYRIHSCTYPLLVALPSVSFIFYSYYFSTSDTWQTFSYIGMFGLLLATLINWHRIRLQNKRSDFRSLDKKNMILLISTIICPHCKHKKEEEMPENNCQFLYECENCRRVLKPLQGDCCVYCSFGTVPCPPIQTDKKCC